MKAYLIDPEKQSIETIEINNQQDIIDTIGFDTIESDSVGVKGDWLFFDEECFLRGSSGRFQIDSIIPVSGKAIVIGAKKNGSIYQDVHIDLDELRSRTKFL